MKDRSGYVFESNGKWYARITVTDSLGQRRNIKRTAESKAEAKQILRGLQKELKHGNEQALHNLRLTFGKLCDYYVEHYAKEALFDNDQKVEGLRDYKRVRSFVELFRAHFGKRNLGEISYDDLRTFRAKRMKVPTVRGERSITTVNRELTYLRRMFNVALRQGWLDRNPFSCGEPLILVSCERKREKVLTVDEERRLLAACNDSCRRHLRPLLIALLDTGARKGEMLKLTWHDVDLNREVINIRAMNSKTLKSRQLPITARLHYELSNLWTDSDKEEGSLVFGITNDFKRAFTTACKIAGIKKGGLHGLNVHSLRHTAATRLVQGNLPIEFVGRILGHSQPATTYRYINANDGVLTSARRILESNALA